MVFMANLKMGLIFKVLKISAFCKLVLLRCFMLFKVLKISVILS